MLKLTLCFIQNIFFFFVSEDHNHIVKAQRYIFVVRKYFKYFFLFMLRTLLWFIGLLAIQPSDSDGHDSFQRILNLILAIFKNLSSLTIIDNKGCSFIENNLSEPNPSNTITNTQTPTTSFKANQSQSDEVTKNLKVITVIKNQAHFIILSMPIRQAHLVMHHLLRGCIKKWYCIISIFFSISCFWAVTAPFCMLQCEDGFVTKFLVSQGTCWTGVQFQCCPASG